MKTALFTAFAMLAAIGAIAYAVTTYTGADDDDPYGGDH